MSTSLGVVVVMIAGIIMGGGAWPMKLMKKLQFEHWWFIGMLVGLIIMPWAVTLIFCPNAIQAYGTVPMHTLILSNLFSLGWGVANVLCGLCYVRIGMALTGAILTGLGVSLGVTMPMIFKGSGMFHEAASIDSPAAKAVLLGVTIMIVGVLFASMAGFGRDRALKKSQKTEGSFLAGLIMTIAAGLLSAGISFAFVYSQGPIVQAMKHNGASEVAATFAVWAVGLSGGALINIIYPMILMTKKKSWGVLARNGKEVALAGIIGVNFCISTAMMGKGMLMLGALGASVGFGIQQAMQMLGGQGTGFISGEWHGVHGLPRRQMYIAIGLLIVAAVIMAYGNTLAKS
jgi:hypothetical protein